MSTDVENAVTILAKNLSEDPELRETYRANIAMCMKDEFWSKKVEIPNSIELFNAGAERFISVFVYQAERSAGAGPA